MCNIFVSCHLQQSLYLCGCVAVSESVLRCHLPQLSWHNNLMQFITARKAKQNQQKFFAIITREGGRGGEWESGRWEGVKSNKKMQIVETN